MRFKDKVVVVTGAARGQGAEEARQLAAEGARIYVTDIRKEMGEALTKELGSKAVFVEHDVSSEESWGNLASKVQNDGGLDGLVNNAAIFDPRFIADTDVPSFDRHMAINQRGCFLGIKFAEQTVGENGASVVNISSLAGMRGFKGIAYGGTKWAVRGMTKIAAVELAAKKIRCNSIHPGIIDTDLLEDWTEEHFKSRVANIPMKRAGTPNDIAKVVLFLLSDDSAYVTGAEITVDGGLGL